MSNNSLQFTVIDDCRCNVFVSSVQIIGDSANKKVVATVSYESSLSIKGFQLDFSVPWAEVVEMLAPGDIVGTSDIDVFQQRKNIDGTWSAAIDSSPASQQIIAWDTSGVDKPIPATFDIYEEKEINGPSVLCRVVFTPNTEYSTFLDDNEIPPSHREMSNALTKAVAVSFQLGKSVPVASWSPELKDNQSIPNIIANDIFDAHHNGYNLSSDAKTAESEGLMGSIHVGDIVAAQEVIDQGLANPEIQNYNQYSVVPSVICNRVADTAPPQYESNCVGTSLKCTADSNRNLVLDVFALPSGGEDMSIATIHSPIPAKTCKIAGYHVLIELKLPFEFDLDNTSVTLGNGAAQIAGMNESVVGYETLNGKQYIEVFAYPQFNNNEQNIPESETPVKLTSVVISTSVPFDRCDNLISWKPTNQSNPPESYGVATPLFGLNAHGNRGTRIWSGEDSGFKPASNSWTGDRTGEGVIDLQDYNSLVTEVLAGGGLSDFKLDASGDGQSDVSDIIAMVKWLNLLGEMTSLGAYSAPSKTSYESTKDNNEKVWAGINGIVPSLCCDNFPIPEEKEPQVFRNNCGCQLEKLGCVNTSGNLYDISFSLKYQPSTVPLSGFEFIAEIPSNVTAASVVEIDLGGDARASGQIVKGSVYQNSTLNKKFLKVVGFGLRSSEDEQIYPEIPAGAGPVLVNFTMKDVVLDAGCDNSFFLGTKLELYSNKVLSFPPPSWNGDYNLDNLITQDDFGQLFAAVMTDVPNYPPNVLVDPTRTMPSTLDIVSVSNWMYQRGLSSDAATQETVIKVVPQITCSDTCRVIWEAEELKINEECILEYSVGEFTRVGHTEDAPGSSKVLENLNLPFDYSPQYKDLVVEIKYKSSCNLAGVQFDLDLVGLPAGCYRVKGAFGGLLSNSQNWVWRYDAKGFSRTIVGLINGCCPEDTQTGWTIDSSCPTTGQIPFTLEEKTLCYLVIDSQNCPDVDLNNKELIQIKKQKGVTLDKAGGRLSDLWTGKRAGSTNTKIDKFDFESCLAAVVRPTSTVLSQFDANSDSQVDVLDAVFMAECMFYCLPYGPYNWSGLGDYYGTLDGDQNGIYTTTHVSTTVAQKPRLKLPAYCCDEEDQNCRANIKVVDVECDLNKKVIVATVAYQSSVNTVAGMQFDLAYNFKANKVDFKQVDVEGQNTYSSFNKQFKDVFNSGFVSRFILSPTVDVAEIQNGGSPNFVSNILPQQINNTVFAKIIFQDVDLGKCDCPSIKFYTKNSSKQFGEQLVEFSGRTHTGKDGGLWTGLKPSPKSTKVIEKINGLSLCQARIVTNDFRTPVKSYPNPAAFDASNYIWTGDSSPEPPEVDYVATVGEAMNNGIYSGPEGIGKYKYHLDANWDGKIDIADIISFYNWHYSGNAFVGKTYNVVPTYICKLKDFSNCSRPNCCDGEPCDETQKDGGLYLHFSAPYNYDPNQGFPSAWSDLYNLPVSWTNTSDITAIPHTAVQIKLCAKNSNIKYIDSVQFELNLPEDTQIIQVSSGDSFSNVQMSPDGRTIIVSGGPEGDSIWNPVAAITADAGPLTIATVFLSPSLTEKLCFGCGKIKNVTVSSCCPDVLLWSPDTIYTEGDLAKGIRVYNKDTGELIDANLYSYLEQKKDASGVPILDENGQPIYQLVIPNGSVISGVMVYDGTYDTIIVSVVETEECWEHLGHFGKPPQAVPSAIPGTNAGNRFWKLSCVSVITTEYEGGTHVLTSDVPFKHPSATLEMHECYERQRSNDLKDPTSRKVYYNPQLQGSIMYTTEVYDNVTTNAGDSGGSVVVGLNSVTTQNENTGSVSTSVGLSEGRVGTVQADSLNIRDSRYKELSFGECHPCVTCCSPEADSYEEMVNYKDGMYFPSGDIDLYLQIVGPNLIDIKYCTDKKISSFQLGVKLNDNYKIVKIDEAQGVALNTDYDLSLSQYSSMRDSQNVHVITGQLKDDGCDTQGAVPTYIGGCSAGHQTLFRLELKSDEQDGVVWGRDVLDAAFEEITIEVLDEIVLSFNKYDPAGLFIGYYDYSQSNIIVATPYGEFVYVDSIKRLCFKEPYDKDGTMIRLLGVDLTPAATGFGEVRLGNNPQNVSITPDGVISVDGVDVYEITFVKWTPQSQEELVPGFTTVFWNASSPQNHEHHFEPANGFSDPTRNYTLSRAVPLYKNALIQQTSSVGDKLRCPPLYPSDSCFSSFITEIMCITEPSRFVTVSQASRAGYLDPTTGQWASACIGATQWDSNSSYSLGDKVWVGQECECYVNICDLPPEVGCPNPEPGVGADWELTWRYFPDCDVDCDTDIFIDTDNVKVPEACPPLNIPSSCDDSLEYNPSTVYQTGDVVWYQLRDNCWRYTGPNMILDCDPSTQEYNSSSVYAAGDVVHYQGECYTFQGTQTRIDPCCILPDGTYDSSQAWSSATQQSGGYQSGDIVWYQHYDPVAGTTTTNCYTYTPQMGNIQATTTVQTTETQTLSAAMIADPDVITINGQSPSSFVWSGNFNDTFVYSVGDMVTFAGNYYVLDSQPQAQQRSIGYNFTCPGPIYDSSLSYSAGDVVIHNGICYRLKDNCPPTGTTTTQSNFDCTGAVVFDNTIAYDQSTVVTFGGDCYKLEGSQTLNPATPLSAAACSGNPNYVGQDVSAYVRNEATGDYPVGSVVYFTDLNKCMEKVSETSVTVVTGQESITVPDCPPDVPSWNPVQNYVTGDTVQTDNGKCWENVGGFVNVESPENMLCSFEHGTILTIGSMQKTITHLCNDIDETTVTYLPPPVDPNILITWLNDNGCGINPDTGVAWTVSDLSDPMKAYVITTIDAAGQSICFSRWCSIQVGGGSFNSGDPGSSWSTVTSGGYDPNGFPLPDITITCDGWSVNQNYNIPTFQHPSIDSNWVESTTTQFVDINSHVYDPNEWIEISNPQVYGDPDTDASWTIQVTTSTTVYDSPDVDNCWETQTELFEDYYLNPDDPAGEWTTQVTVVFNEDVASTVSVDNCTQNPLNPHDSVDTADGCWTLCETTVTICDSSFPPLSNFADACWHLNSRIDACENSVPAIGSECWELIEPCCPDASSYDSQAAYNLGEIVTHNQKCWKSIQSGGTLGEPGVSSDWEEFVCVRDCIETETDENGNIILKSGKAVIPVWYKTSCTNISGFSFKVTGVPDCSGAVQPEMFATLAGGVAGLADFAVKSYEDDNGDFWVVGVLTDLKKLIQPTDNVGKLLTNVVFIVEEWEDCFDWSQIKVCAPRFVSNTKLDTPHSMWTGDFNSDGYITPEDVEMTMLSIGESWNSGNFNSPWREFIDARYDGLIRIEDAVTIQNHRLMNANDDGTVRPGMTALTSSGNSVYGYGTDFVTTHRPNVERAEPISRNIVPQVCCEEEIYADCLCPCDEIVEEPCFDNLKIKIIPTRLKSKEFSKMVAPSEEPSGKTVDGYFIQVFYSSSCCLDGYWVEFDGINNIPGAELNIYPAPNAEPVKKKWLQYTGWGEDSYLTRGPLDLVPTNVIFGWYRAPYVRQDGNPSFTPTGPDGFSGVAVTHYENQTVEYEKSCIPATEEGEWKILSTVFVRKDALNHDSDGEVVPPTIKKHRLITNEKMNLPAVGWTGDVAGFDGSSIVMVADGKVGLVDELGAMLGAVVGATGTQIPVLDAEGDGKYLDIVDIVTIWNHYMNTLSQAILSEGALGALTGAPLPKPMIEIVPTDCCPETCDEDKPGAFKLKVIDCKDNPIFGCDGKYPNSVGLDWEESENAKGYRVYRSDNPLVPVHVSYDPSVTTWIDLNPPLSGGEESEMITIGSGKNKVLVEKTGCCGDETLEPVYYVVIAFNNCGELASNVDKAEICCCNEGPKAKDIEYAICMNETIRGLFVAYDADVPPMSDCDPTIEDCDALYYEIMSVTNGSVAPPPGHVQPGPVGQFIFTPDPDFVGIATVEYKVWDTSGCWDCGIIIIKVLPEAPTITRIETGDCGESKYGKVIVAWSVVSGADEYNIYRRKVGDVAWVKVATVLSPENLYFDDGLPELPAVSCTDGIEYEYVISSIKNITLPAGALKADCEEEQKENAKFTNKNNCCSSIGSTEPELSQKIEIYNAAAEKNGWEDICLSTRAFLLNKGFSWYEIGLIDCCCKKEFYELRNVNPAEKQMYKELTGLTIEEARIEYKSGFTKCCDMPTNTNNKPDIIKLESCIETVIPKPDICCGTPRIVEIPCCPDDSLTCDDWNITTSATVCSDTAHPQVSVYWDDLSGAASYRVSIKNAGGNLVYSNAAISLMTSTSPLVVKVPPCFCPDVSQSFTITIVAVDGSGNVILECEEVQSVDCCTVPMTCPPEEDRVWFTDKNEAVFGKVPPVVNNNPNCKDEDIIYSLWTDDSTDCCPDYNTDGTRDCGPFNGTLYKASTFSTTKELGIDTNGDFVYVPDPHWVSEYDADGNPLLPTAGGPDSFTYKAVDCCGEEICCTATIHVVIDICNENDYVICDATIAYLSSQFVKNASRPGGEVDQVPFSLNRRGGQTIRKTKRAYVVTKGMNPLLDPDYE